jgi:two-component system phosphate regulon response regulator PhoB
MATVLIVDDEAPVRDFLAGFLEDVGHRTIAAINGTEALALVAQERPDVVLSDIMMPVLNGAELCRRLKAGAETRSIPVILMSSAGQTAAAGTGADAFIAKPFDSLDEVAALVRRWSRLEGPGQAPPRGS